MINRKFQIYKYLLIIDILVFLIVYWNVVVYHVRTFYYFEKNNNFIFKDIISITNINKIHHPIIESNYNCCFMGINNADFLLTSKNFSNVYYIHTQVIREYNHYIHIKYMYVDTEYQVFDGEKIVIFHSDDKVIKKNYTSINAEYEQAIFLFTQYPMFGHLIHDCLPGLIGIPKDIVDKSIVILPYFFNKIALQYLPLFGIPKNRIVAEKDHLYFAENLYMFYTWENIQGYYPQSFIQLAVFLKNKLGVNKIKGTRYIFLNRPKGKTRSVVNMEKFYNETIKIFPDYHWEISQNFCYENVSIVSKEFASYKFLIIPSGSNVNNAIYMNDNFQSFVCLIQSFIADIANYQLFLSLKIITIGFNHMIQHYWGPPFTCNISYGINCIRRLLYIKEHGKWPSDTFKDMRLVFNLKEIQRLFIKNQTKQYYPIIKNNKEEYLEINSIAFGFPSIDLRNIKKVKFIEREYT